VVFHRGRAVLNATVSNDVLALVFTDANGQSLGHLRSTRWTGLAVLLNTVFTERSEKNRAAAINAVGNHEEARIH
jgi:hypothetical protein